MGYQEHSVLRVDCPLPSQLDNRCGTCGTFGVNVTPLANYEVLPHHTRVPVYTNIRMGQSLTGMYASASFMPSLCGFGAMYIRTRNAIKGRYDNPPTPCCCCRKDSTQRCKIIWNTCLRS
jgi:hypothetical protein